MKNKLESTNLCNIFPQGLQRALCDYDDFDRKVQERNASQRLSSMLQDFLPLLSNIFFGSFLTYFSLKLMSMADFSPPLSIAIREGVVFCTAAAACIASTAIILNTLPKFLDAFKRFFTPAKADELKCNISYNILFQDLTQMCHYVNHLDDAQRFENKKDFVAFLTENPDASNCVMLQCLRRTVRADLLQEYPGQRRSILASKDPLAFSLSSQSASTQQPSTQQTSYIHSESTPKISTHQR